MVFHSFLIICNTRLELYKKRILLYMYFDYNMLFLKREQILTLVILMLVNLEQS